MDTEDALNFVYEEAKKQGASQFDVVAGESNSLGIDLFEGKVKNTEISSSRGIGIRLFVGDHPGYAFTEKLSKEAIQQCVKDAMGHTKLTDSLNVELPESSPLPEIELGLWQEGIEKVSMEDMKSIGLELEEHAIKKDKRVENIPYLSVSKSSGKSWIVNSRGLRYEVKSNSMAAGLGVVAVKDENRKMGVYFNHGSSKDGFDTKYMAEIAVDRAVELLGANSIESGQYPVLLSNRISPQLISMYSSPYYAEVVQKGQSKLEGKLNQKIAVDNFNLNCSPHLNGFPGSQLFDSEGVLCQDTNVIQNGELMSYLYNLESAKKENKTPTGHASRGYSGQVGTGFSNFIVEKGTETFEDLLSKVPKCFYVTNLEGGSGCSSVSGEISIGAQGFWVERGEKVNPVEGVTISSNYFDLLKNIQGISDSYNDIVSAVKVPDILVGSMYVAG